MIQIRLSRFLILLFLIFGTAAIGAQAVVNPNVPSPQTVKSIPVESPPAEVTPKTSAEEVIELAHTVVATAEYIGGALAIILGLAAISSLATTWRYERRMVRLHSKFLELEEARKIIAQEVNTLDKKLEKLGEKKDAISKEMDNLKEQESSLRESSEKVSKEVTELREQEISIRKFAATVQAVILVRSRLGVETRLKALQKLSQLLDPQGIAPLLEVLIDSESDIGLRLEANYGLSRFSEDAVFREFYPEIFAGFREVLSDPETPPKLASEVIKSARRFEAIPDELASLFKKWEQIET